MPLGQYGGEQEKGHGTGQIASGAQQPGEGIVQHQGRKGIQGIHAAAAAVDRQQDPEKHWKEDQRGHPELEPDGLVIVRYGVLQHVPKGF